MARADLHASGTPAPPAAADWSDLRTFLAIIAAGSLSAAAEATADSVATVGRRLRRLERDLGVALFTRSPNRLILTQAGRAVLEAAEPMASAAAAVPRIAEAFRARDRAPVRITATASVTLFLSREVVALSAAAEAREVSLLPTRRRLDLLSEADIALRMRILPDCGPQLVGRRIGSVAFAVYEAQGGTTAVIVPPEDPALSRQAALIDGMRGSRTIAARIGDTPTRYQAARAGLGAAVLPCWLGDSDPSLRRIAAPRPDDTEDVFLLMHRRSRERSEVAGVAQALVDLFRRHRNALAGGAA